MPKTNRGHNQKKVQIWMSPEEIAALEQICEHDSYTTNSGALRDLVSRRILELKQLDEGGGGDIIIRRKDGKSAIVVPHGFG